MGEMGGFAATVVIGIAFLAVALIIVSFSNKNKGKDFEPCVFLSGEAVKRKDELDLEFCRLVSSIAFQRGKEAGKMHALKKGERVPEERLITPEEVEAAFAEAAAQVRLDDVCPSSCDKRSLLEKLRHLRKQRENKTP